MGRAKRIRKAKMRSRKLRRLGWPLSIFDFMKRAKMRSIPVDPVMFTDVGSIQIDIDTEGPPVTFYS